MKKKIRFKKYISVLCGLLLLLSVLAACAASDAGTAAEKLPEIPAETANETTEPEPEQDAQLYCSLTIRCDTILQNMDRLVRGKESLIPEDGLLFEEEKVPFSEGESVFDVLRRELQARRLHLEFSENPLYGSVYVEGIFNLYELDCGELSGWIYRVNGETPGYGCSKYLLSDGDRVEWLYTCDLGNDL